MTIALIILGAGALIFLWIFSPDSNEQPPLIDPNAKDPFDGPV